MEGAFARPIPDVLGQFGVDAKFGLTDEQVVKLRAKYGKNGELRLSTINFSLSPKLCADQSPSLIAIPEEPPTPLWELILEQFKDQLVIILLGSAAVSFVLALFEDEGGWSAFVDPAVVSIPRHTSKLGKHLRLMTDIPIYLVDIDYPRSKCRRRRVPRKQCGKSHCRAPRILGQCR